MAIDATRVADVITHMHSLWSGMLHSHQYINIDCFQDPLQVIFALALLYRQMQWSIIPGVALLLIMIPINLFLQRIQKKLTVCVFV
jgi:hypothetical protein